MAWLKLDDKYDDHPKIVAAGPEASWLDVRGMLYCARHETDGYISESQLKRIGGDFSARKRRGLVEKLVEVGRWIQDEERGGWCVHDFLAYNFSAEEAQRRREDKAKAGRKGGLASGASRRSKIEADASVVASTETNPDPTRPVPEPHKNKTGGVFNTTRLTKELKESVAEGLGQDPEDEALAELWNAFEEEFGRGNPIRHPVAWARSMVQRLPECEAVA